MLSPFNYKIVDNFLEEDDFNIIIDSVDKKILEKIGENEIKIFPHKLSNSEIKTSSIPKKILRKFHEKYHSKCMEILKDLYSERLDLYD